MALGMAMPVGWSTSYLICLIHRTISWLGPVISWSPCWLPGNWSRPRTSLAHNTTFCTLVFVWIKQIRYRWLIFSFRGAGRGADFLTFGQYQARCFPPFPVFELSYISRLLEVASVSTSYWMNYHKICPPSSGQNFSPKTCLWDQTPTKLSCTWCSVLISKWSEHGQHCTC